MNRSRRTRIATSTTPSSGSEFLMASVPQRSACIEAAAACPPETNSYTAAMAEKVESEIATCTSSRKTTEDVRVSQALASVEMGNNRSSTVQVPTGTATSASRTQHDYDSNNNVGLEAPSSNNSISFFNQTTEATMTPSAATATSVVDSATAGANGEILKNFEEDKCRFCCVDLGAQDGVMLQICLHVFCRDCLQTAIELQTESITIPCPISEEFKCGGYLTNGEVKALVRPEVFQEYLDRSLVIAKKKMKNVFNCKTNGCSSWCEFEEGRKTFICPQCEQTNCMECNAIHTGVDCFTFKDFEQKGQLSKVKELMEKEEKNGWAQLTAMVNASGKSQYNILAENDLLQNSMEFECSICFTEIAPGDGVILHECLHLFCKDCLVNVVEHNDETTVKCPYIDGNYSCVDLMQPREIKALVPQATYDKHLQRSLKLGESSIENSFHCKTPDCNGWCVFDEGDRVFKCPICRKPNCIACKAIHTGSCENYKNRLKQNENDKLSEEAVEKLIQTGEYMRCPKCKIPVQKTVGCDWIQCSACKTEICWVTRGPRWGPKGRGDNTGGCRCKVKGNKCHKQCGNCH